LQVNVSKKILRNSFGLYSSYILGGFNLDFNNIDKMPLLIKELYSIIHKLEQNFPGRHFTPDGHLVGSIGEVLASYHYGLELLSASTEIHDAKTRDGRLVQIKATQGKSIGLRSEPDYLIVIKILPNGQYEEVYNGQGKVAWDSSGSMQKNGQRSISVTRLRKLMESVQDDYRISKISKGKITRARITKRSM
jgi:hypothetical protein